MLQTSGFLKESTNKDSPTIKILGIVKIPDILDQVLDAASSFAVLPTTTIANAANFIIESNGATRRDIRRLAPPEAVLEQIKGNGSLLIGSTFVELCHVDSMLERTVFDQRPLWNIGILSRETHRESKVDLRIGVQFGSAELNQISQTLFLAVHAGNAVVMISFPTNV